MRTIKNSVTVLISFLMIVGLFSFRNPRGYEKAIYPGKLVKPQNSTNLGGKLLSKDLWRVYTVYSNNSNNTMKSDNLELASNSNFINNIFQNIANNQINIARIGNDLRINIVTYQKSNKEITKHIIDINSEQQARLRKL